VVAAAILMGGAVGLRMASVVFGALGWQAPLVVEVPVSAAMCILLVIGTCNAVNLIDGLDGLCGGITGIISLGFLGLAAYLATYGWQAETDSLRVAVCFAMAGAVLGFLPYNVPPASIFMGDAGSMLLGFFVAAMMALFCRENTFRWFLAAIVVFGLPIVDTGLAVIRRLLSGKRIFVGDRSHLYDQLVDRGMTVRKVVGLFYVLAAVAAVAGVGAAVWLRLRHAIILYAALLVAVAVTLTALGMVRPAARRPADKPAKEE
jgi:UDP-GlcNAc:undecaprenyl-phosphate GlcNAc-1-phosphate transferase